ncbi:DUF3137 domain-containing protein [bacterium]|nr:DUF3137 domain-containing protein [bacterium]
MPSDSVKRSFEAKYLSNLETHVLPLVKNFETERRIRLIIASCIAAVVVGIAITFVVSMILIYLKIGADSQFIQSIKPVLKICSKKGSILILAIAFFLWKKIQQDFEYKIKNRIMPALISAFDGFKWSEIAPDEYYQDVMDSDIFLYKENTKIINAYSDYFVGYYDDVKLEFSQAMYYFKGYDFNGGLIRINMNKSFSGETVLRPKGVSYKDLEKMGLEKVALEDTEFSKKFNIYTTDQIEARYLLTPDFMQKLKNISIQYMSTDKIYCSFCKDKIYIAPQSKHGMFSMFGLTKRTDDPKIFQILYAQVNSAIELVEHLKLNIKTGL